MNKFSTLSKRMLGCAFAIAATLASTFTAKADDDYEGVTFTKLSDSELMVTFLNGAYFVEQTDAMNNVNQVYVTQDGIDKKYIAWSNVKMNSTFNTNSNISFNISSLNLADGDYIFVMPANYIKVMSYVSNDLPGMGLNQEMEFNFSVGEGTSTTVVYEPQYTVSDNSIVIKWVSDSGLQATLATGTNAGAYVTNNQTQERYDLVSFDSNLLNYSTQNIRVENNQVNINLANGDIQLSKGSYTITIPAGFFKINGEDNEVVNYSFDYTGIWTMGEIETSFNEETKIVTMTWVDATAVVYNDEYEPDPTAGDDGILLYDGDDNNISIPKENISYNENSMMFSLEGLTVAAGECHISIPIGMIKVTVDGITNPSEQDAMGYFQNGEKVVAPTIPVYQLEATWAGLDQAINENSAPISVSWGGYSLKYNEDSTDKVSAFNPESGNVILEYGKEVTLSNDNKSLLISLNAVVAGTYVVSVPEGYVIFAVDGTDYLNQGTQMSNVKVETSASVSIDSITSGSVNNAEIYNLQGVKVGASKMKSGLYIINGKKVLVK